jgi:hypothetical protein
MKRVLVVLAAGVAALALATLSGCGSAERAGERTVTVFEKDDAETFAPVDLPPTSKTKGAQATVSPGDLFIVTGPVFGDEARKKPIGRIFGQVTGTSAGKTFFHSSFLAHLVLKLSSGTIVVDGAFKEGPMTTGAFAVTGGTGAYARVRGTFTSKHTQAGEVDTVHLLP